MIRKQGLEEDNSRSERGDLNFGEVVNHMAVNVDLDNLQALG